MKMFTHNLRMFLDIQELQDQYKTLGLNKSIKIWSQSFYQIAAFGLGLLKQKKCAKSTKNMNLSNIFGRFREQN